MVLFQSAPPAKGAITRSAPPHGLEGFQSAPPAKGAIQSLIARTWLVDVSIRAPREGGDSRIFSHVLAAFRFQSAPPAKGAMTPQC